MVCTKSADSTYNSGVTTITTKNPLQKQPIVNNQGNIQVFNRNVYARVDVSTDNGLTWNTYINPPLNSPAMWTVSGLTFNVGESKTVDFPGPNITNETAAGRLFRVTVWVDPDQNNANNQLTK